MTVFSIACIQTDYGLGDNVEAMTRDLGKVMRRYPWVEMVMFPELAAFGPNSDNAQVMPGSAEAHFCALAAKYAIWLLPGSMYELSGKDIYNTASVINPQGEIRHSQKLFAWASYPRLREIAQEMFPPVADAKAPEEPRPSQSTVKFPAPPARLSRLVYLSCGFAAFQRDCDALVKSGEWRLTHAEGFNFFPGSDHVETLAVFDREETGAAFWEG